MTLLYSFKIPHQNGWSIIVQAKGQKQHKFHEEQLQDMLLPVMKNGDSRADVTLYNKFLNLTLASNINNTYISPTCNITHIKPPT